MFDHPNFDNYAFEEIPLDRDICLIDAALEVAYHEMMVSLFSGGNYDYNSFPVAFAAAHSINGDVIEASWYPNTFDRFHEIDVVIPRSVFVRCVGSLQTDEKPRLFVQSEWLRNLIARSYSTYAMVDVANMTELLRQGIVTQTKLVAIRDEIDKLAEAEQSILFLSFADSILMKSNWIAHDKLELPYEPEKFIDIAEKIDKIYRNLLDAETYMILAQGSNEYYSESVSHVSSSGNHISLNSIGLPFAVLMEIEAKARACIRSREHKPQQLYMDQTFLRSVKFEFPFGPENLSSVEYTTKLRDLPGRYYYASRETIASNLRLR